MYAQFFGSFLLSKDSVTPEQLTAAISQASETRLKLGTLALHKYYMTAEQVDEVCFLETVGDDLRSGQIARHQNSICKSTGRSIDMGSRNLITHGKTSLKYIIFPMVMNLFRYRTEYVNIQKSQASVG